MGQFYESASDAGRRPRVLCIDDDPDISRSLEIRLTPLGVEVLRAVHGMHGFWLAMTERPDLIITDMRMPQGHGDYVAECLKANSDTSHIPIFVLTGTREAGVEQRMKKLGVERFFTKPVEFDYLRSRLAEYIDLVQEELEPVA